MKTQSSETSIEIETPPLSPSYQEIRAAGKDLFAKIMEATRHLDFDMVKAARKMTLPTEERTFLFDSETDQNALLDFYVCEYRRGGKTKVEACAPQVMNFTPLLAGQLRALQESRTSLFDAHSVVAERHQLILRDLLEPERPDFPLTDIGLSATVNRYKARILLFTRIVSLYGFHMTAGFSFTFSSKYADMLVAGYHQRMKTVLPADRAERRFVFFYQMHQKYGQPQAYQDVGSKK
jgi:hypothetical protein